MITGHFYQCSIKWHSVGAYMEAILKNQTWGELIVNANALIMHSFFSVIQGND